MDTFLVRIWTDDEGLDEGPDAGQPREPGPPRLRGIVRHVRTGDERRFADAGELVAVLGAASRPSVPAGTPRSAAASPAPGPRP